MEYNLMLRKFRDEKGLTQQELADPIGVAKSSVAHWELGIKRISVRHLIALADLFGCTADQLLGRDPPGRTSA